MSKCTNAAVPVHIVERAYANSVVCTVCLANVCLANVTGSTGSSG